MALSILIGDLRFGMRVLWKTPGFALIAILTLALGIGTSTAIFSLVDGTLLRGLPYRDSDRLVMVWQDATYAGYPRATPTPADYAAWKQHNRSFSGMAAMRVVSGSLTSDGPPEQLIGQAVTADFFHVLGVEPALGRVFTEAEDQTSAQVVLISYGLWIGRYEGDPSIVGRNIPLNSGKFTVLGVLPKEFVFQNRQADYWIPASLTPAMLANRSAHFLNVVARLKPGTTMAQARSDLHAIAVERQEQGLFDKRSGVVAVSLRNDLLGNTRLALLVLLAATGCVLMIACANVANLLLARGISRSRELAIRASLGAGRARLVRQMVTEGVLLSCAGGGIGLAVAVGTVGVLARLVPPGMPYTATPEIDLRLLGFAFAVSMMTGLASSIGPALRTANASLNAESKQGGRTNGGAGLRIRDVLVVVEVAGTLVLLVGATLLLRTMANLRATDVGFRSDHLLTMRTAPARTTTHTERINYYDRVLAGVRALPGVENAAFVSDLPFQQSGNSQSFEIEGSTPLQEGPARLALYRACTNDYLKTLGVTLIAGRLFERSDGASSVRAVVITETLSRQFFREGTPLGHRIKVGDPAAPWLTIIGVVADVHERGYEPAMMPGVYIPIAQTPDAPSVPRELIVRTSVDPLQLADPIRRVVYSVNPMQPVGRVRTMEEWVDLDVADRKQQTVLLGTFAGLALLLSGIGLYGVLSYMVTHRRREIGVRLALGATTENITKLFVQHGLQITAVGLVIGCALAWALTRVLKGILYGVNATDPATFASVVVLFLMVAAAACWIPARRASRVDPIVILREE